MREVLGVAERIHVRPDRKARMVERARDFRKEPTASEALLWQALRGSGLGVRFRRQQPVGPFIVDFFCASHGLIIEVDGAAHDQQTERDQERQSLLEACGYRLLRFTASQVECNLDWVVTQINAALRHSNVSSDTPPLPGRERGLGGEGRTPT